MDAGKKNNDIAGLGEVDGALDRSERAGFGAAVVGVVAAGGGDVEGR